MPTNTLVTPQMITQLPLIILKNTTRFVPNVDRMFEKDFGNKRMKIGATEQLRRPARFLGRDGQAWTPEGLTDTFVPLTINFQHGVDFEFSSIERALSIEEMTARYLKPAATSIANKVDYNFGRYMALSTANLVGTPGTSATGSTAQQVYAGAQVLLDQMAFPTDDRCVVYNSAMSSKLATTNLTLFNPVPEISKAYRKGLQGEFVGFEFYKDENTNVYTFGTYTGTPVVNGGGQVGSSLILSGFTSSTFVGNVGDVFTIGGVYAVNPQSRQSTGSLQQFVLTAAATDTAGAATVQIYPPIIPSGQFQNVTNSPATNSAIVFAGATSGGSAIVSPTGIAFEKSAFSAAFVPLEVPTAVEEAYMEKDEDTGIYMRYLMQYDGVRDMMIGRFDVVYGITGSYLEGSVRVSQ
jgi:hypothetical protein